MLQTQTAEPQTLSLLRDLFKLPCLQGFALVGDTAISLWYGHHLSVDWDLFTTPKFENEDFIPSLGMNLEIKKTGSKKVWAHLR